MDVITFRKFIKLYPYTLFICLHVNLSYCGLHRLSDLNKAHLLLTLLEIGSHDKAWQIRYLMKTHFLVQKGCLFTMSLHGETIENAPWGLLYKGTNTIHDSIKLVQW